MQTKIYGASDDLIEIEGAFEEEANHYDATNLPLTASDGTKAKITYNGDWKFEVTEKGSKFLKLIPSVGDDAEHSEPEAVGCSSYSDVLVLDEGIEWVMINRKKYKP